MLQSSGEQLHGIIQQPSLLCVMDWVRTQRKLLPVALKVVNLFFFLPECLIATFIALH